MTKPMNAINLVQSHQVTRLQINNPRRRNALSRNMWQQILALVDQLNQQDTSSVLIIESSTPGCFSSGADISEFEANYADPATSIQVNREIHQAIDAVERCPFPTIALIDGPCVGGGLGLALACDIRLASAQARFSLTPSKLGLSYHPDDIRRLLLACGSANASELLFGAQAWQASRALQAGLVNQVLPSDAFESEAQQLIDSICANSSAANQVLKQSIRSIQSGNAEAIRSAGQAFEELFSRADFIAGREAFLNKTAVSFPSNQQQEP